MSLSSWRIAGPNDYPRLYVQSLQKLQTPIPLSLDNAVHRSLSSLQLMNRKPLSAPLLAFDVMNRLDRTKRKLEEQKKETKVATRKMAVKKAPPPVQQVQPSPKMAFDFSKVILNWKTEDQQLDFELTIDDVGDMQVSCFDADHDEPIEMAACLSNLDEVISILMKVRADFLRIKTGDIKPADTENWVADDERDEPDEEEEDDEEEEEEEDNE